MGWAETVAEVTQKRRLQKLLAGNLEASRLVGQLDSEEGLILKWVIEMWSLALWI
jgi:hypothetical protein